MIYTKSETDDMIQKLIHRYWVKLQADMKEDKKVIRAAKIRIAQRREHMMHVGNLKSHMLNYLYDIEETNGHKKGMMPPIDEVTF